jgi:hypothetical protein
VNLLDVRGEAFAAAEADLSATEEEWLELEIKREEIES